MPSKKYYRCSLPNDVLQLIGNLAGDHLFKLNFTYSKVRGFLSTIQLIPRYDLYQPYKNLTLRRALWNPIRLGNFNLLQKLVACQSSMNIHLFEDNIRVIYKQLAEIQDYNLIVK